jgi:hypothetical protein
VFLIRLDTIGKTNRARGRVRESGIERMAAMTIMVGGNQADSPVFRQAVRRPASLGRADTAWSRSAVIPAL